MKLKHNRVAGSFNPPTPCMRVRTGRFAKITGLWLGNVFSPHSSLTDINPCSASHLLVMPDCIAIVLARCHGPLRLIAVMMACLLEVPSFK
ncbi:MAG: hypothetical protein GXP56_17680 [Deltaproteobacteria bacterium]|nr:hypothetical protein [Deltaproteobacteria bacterium]